MSSAISSGAIGILRHLTMAALTWLSSVSGVFIVRADPQRTTSEVLQQATIDPDHLSRNIAGRWRNKKCDQRGHFFGQTRPAERNVAQQLAALLIRQPGNHVRLDQ